MFIWLRDLFLEAIALLILNISEFFIELDIFNLVSIDFILPTLVYEAEHDLEQ
jgi:hypothetical protein